MLLIFDSNTLNLADNIDDAYSDKLDIPTVIIPKNIGEIIKKYVKNKSNDKILLSIKFSGLIESGKLDMELFFRSDDVKALHFFKEFEFYKNKIGNLLLFTPIFKYNIDEYEQTDNSISASSTAPCVKQLKFCVTGNKELQISNPRVILLENIRQSCIYSIYGTDSYWNYMIIFSEMCADINNPTFNEKCANNSIEKAHLKQKVIEECMQRLIDVNSKIDYDYEYYNKKKIYKTPEILLNGVKYRGNWHSKTIFNSICNGFIDDDDICSTTQTNETTKEEYNAMTIILVVSLGIVIIMILLLICYRRIVNRSLEKSLSERIQIQALKSIKQYTEFKDTESLDNQNPPLNSIDVNS